MLFRYYRNVFGNRMKPRYLKGARKQKLYKWSQQDSFGQYFAAGMNVFQPYLVFL